MMRKDKAPRAVMSVVVNVSGTWGVFYLFNKPLLYKLLDKNEYYKYLKIYI